MTELMVEQFSIPCARCIKEIEKQKISPNVVRIRCLSHGAKVCQDWQRPAPHGNWTPLTQVAPPGGDNDECIIEITTQL